MLSSDFKFFMWTGSTFVDTRDPRPEDMDVPQICRALSRMPRYGGLATPTPWSVAQHSLLAYGLARCDGITNRDILLSVLMHDAAEAFTSDVPRPIKKQLLGLKEIEARFQSAILERLGVTPPEHRIIKHYDMAAFAWEWRQFMPIVAPQSLGLPTTGHLIPPKLLNMGQKKAAKWLLRVLARHNTKFSLR